MPYTTHLGMVNIAPIYGDDWGMVYCCLNHITWGWFSTFCCIEFGTWTKKHRDHRNKNEEATIFGSSHKHIEEVGLSDHNNNFTCWQNWDWEFAVTKWRFDQQFQGKLEYVWTNKYIGRLGQKGTVVNGDNFDPYLEGKKTEWLASIQSPINRPSSSTPSWRAPKVGVKTGFNSVQRIATCNKKCERNGS